MPENPIIQGRKVIFCETLQSYPLSRLFVECSDCHRYFAACCPHDSFGDDWALPHAVQPTCHHAQIVFIDGACTNNGSNTLQAKAGLGITIGDSDEVVQSWSIPVDNNIDTVRPLEDMWQAYKASGGRTDEHAQLARRHQQIDRATYIVVTDSEYVVKGITEWYPSWRERGWRTSEGKRPKNFDLFVNLDAYVTKLESDRVAVGFWLVPRVFNRKADALAKSAANL
ncbi:ribonuclease H-like domain-containing protein [Gymnopilus junonius]|uniref:ribonuclease H n=1 Tax=Gymnopilus junonius TaxID=109634 RepID=A0A9P5NHD3_GYMJU|nr:ribonuclease H-like domain-containing protein [Gymnopilus junonius]